MFELIRTGVRAQSILVKIVLQAELSQTQISLAGALFGLAGTGFGTKLIQISHLDGKENFDL